MPQSFNQWANSVVGRYTDVDGSYGGQCWDTFAHYCINALGISPINTYGGQWSGWAYALWDQFYGNGAAAHFHRVSAGEPARQGDVAVWNTSHWYYPASHVAIVQSDAGGQLYCVSQNSSPAQPGLPGYSGAATGPNIRQYLTKQGLAGYLRPNASWVGDDGPGAPTNPDPGPAPPPVVVVPPPRPLLIPGVPGLYADE